MSAGLKYSLGRVGLFAACFLLTLPLPVPLLIKLMIALVVSAPLSYFLLKRWRLEFAGRLDQRSLRRREQKERLRAALRGDDEPGGDPVDDAEDVPKDLAKNAAKDSPKDQARNADSAS